MTMWESRTTGSTEEQKHEWKRVADFINIQCDVHLYCLLQAKWVETEHKMKAGFRGFSQKGWPPGGERSSGAQNQVSLSRGVEVDDV